MNTIWIIVFVIGTAILAFWPIYDRVKARNDKIQKDLGAAGQAAAFDWIKRTVGECPVCGKNHTGKRGGEKGDGCPFEDGDFFPIWKEHLLESTVTEWGGHFERPYLVWEYDDKVYLTYKPDDYAVKTDQYGQIYVNAYYSALFCRREEWDPAAKKHEMDLAVKELRERAMNSVFETEEYYIVGLDRILDMSVTKEASCAQTGYVIWQGKQGIYVTGIRSGASAELFNYDRISRSGTIHRFFRSYTRRLCSTLTELREMPQDEIDAQAYGAWMDGAR